MKKMILAVVAVAVVGISAQTARAGDCDSRYGRASYDDSAGYGYSAPRYSVSYSSYAPRAVCAPAPVRCAPAPAVIYYPAPCAPRRVVHYAPAPVYQVSYARGHGYGHGRSYSHGRWNR